jgi:hypothetical protein
MEIFMPDEFDTELGGFFECARQPLDGNAFLAETLRKIDRARHARLRRRLIAAVILVAAVASAFPAVLPGAAVLVRGAGEYSLAAAEFSTTPLGWALSAAIGVWVLLRARAPGRS